MGLGHAAPARSDPPPRHPPAAPPHPSRPISIPPHLHPAVPAAPSPPRPPLRPLHVALTRARERTHLYASSDQLELPASREQAITALAARLGRSEPELPSIRVALAHEQHLEREHSQLTLPTDVGQRGGSVEQLRAERDRHRAIIATYPSAAAERVESLERDVQRFQAASDRWSADAERFRGELARMGPFGRRREQGQQVTSRLSNSEHNAGAAREAGRGAQAKLAEIHNGPENPTRWHAEHPGAREQLAEAERAFTQAVEQEAHSTIEHPAEHVVRVLGERPGHDQPTQRREWEQAAQAIETYRITHQIDPTDRTALGPEPRVWDQRHDWQAAATQVLEAREHLGIDKHGHGPPEQRLANIDGLIPERDRERAHDRSHGWER